MSRIKLVTELNNYVCCSCIIIHYSLRYCYSSRHNVISTVSKIKPLKIWIGLTGQPNTMPPIRISSVEWNMTARNKIHVHPLHRRWLIVKATLAFMPAVFNYFIIRSEGPRSLIPLACWKGAFLFWGCWLSHYSQMCRWAGWGHILYHLVLTNYNKFQWLKNAIIYRD